jgi:hypothetical protein
MPASRKPYEWGYALDGGITFLVGADADRIFDAGDKDFAVADLAGLGGLGDGGHGGVHLFVGEDQLEFDLGEEVHGVFAAAIDFRVTLSAARSL